MLMRYLTPTPPEVNPLATSGPTCRTAKVDSIYDARGARLTCSGEVAMLALVVPARDQKGTRCVRERNSAAAPATVSGEFPAINATGSVAFLGRWTDTTTREPGDLPPLTVTRERVGRGVPA